MSKKIKYRTWEDHMQDVLSDPEYARFYLLSRIEEYLEDQELDFFLRNVRYVVDAQIGIEKLASLVDKTEEELEQAFSGEVEPGMDLLLVILQAIGIFDQTSSRKEAA